MNLFDKLQKHHKDNIYPYHMPGHKRKPMTDTLKRVADMDITEIDGFDNLNHPEDMLLEIQQYAAKVYGAEESFFLVGGSTLGILSAISAVAQEGDTILIGRNCHKAVYHAAYLRKLRLEYLWPEYDNQWELFMQVNAELVERQLDLYPEAKAVLIVSPTYEGFCSDIKAIAKVVHDRGKILIVDEAHGAHLGFHPAWPQSAVALGADVVVQSLHKTLPSMTQTAIMHICGKLVDRDKLRRFLTIYQTSSPSYVFMSSMEDAISFMDKEGKSAMECFKQMWTIMLQKLQGCEFIEIYPDMERLRDKGKLLISAHKAGLDGQALHEILLSRFGLQMEMAQGKYVLAMFTVADEQDGYDRLTEALLTLEKEFKVQTKESRNKQLISWGDCRAKQIVPIFQAWDGDWEWVDLDSSQGRCAGDFVNLYPPGIPLVVPGEIFNQTMVSIIKEYCALGLPVHGVLMEEEKCAVRVLKDK